MIIVELVRGEGRCLQWERGGVYSRRGKGEVRCLQ